jgi:hypothetical protein
MTFGMGIEWEWEFGIDMKFQRHLPFLLLVRMMDFDNGRAYHIDDASQTADVV